MLQLSGERCHLPEGSVPAAAAVVAVLDPRTDLESGPFPGRPNTAVVELGLQRREERLSHRVIPADTGVSHRPGQPVRGGERT